MIVWSVKKIQGPPVSEAVVLNGSVVASFLCL